MSVANNINRLSCGPIDPPRRRSVSVLQLSMTLAFIALPATILFPIIATPIQHDTIAAASYSADTLQDRIKFAPNFTFIFKRHMNAGAVAAWKEIKSLSAAHHSW